MRPTQQEFASPREWLSQIAEEADGYRRLVRESGGTGRAAYRLARARCSAAHGGEPSLEDLQAAAQLLATKLGSGGTLPIKSLLPGPGGKSAPPVAKSVAPVAKSAAPAAQSVTPAAKSAAPSSNSAPPAPSSAARAANKSRARQSTPVVVVADS